MAEKYFPQIVLVPDCNRPSASTDIITHVIHECLRVSYELEIDGKKYFAADFEEKPDLSGKPRPDVIMLDRTKHEDEAAARAELILSANFGGRVFAQADDLIRKEHMPRGVKYYTYSISDPDVNFYAQKIREKEDGSGYTFEVVYQANPDGKGGLKALLFPTYNNALICRTDINSPDRKDIIHAVKAFAIGTALSIEPKYITKAISSYDFLSNSKSLETLDGKW